MKLLTSYLNSHCRGTLSVNAYTSGDDFCPSYEGMSGSWIYASSNGFVAAGDGLEVVCSDTGATQIKTNNL